MPIIEHGRRRSAAPNANLRTWPAFLFALSIAGGGALSGAARATEGGGTAYPLGVATINPGLEPTPPGLNFITYNTYYTASHTRNSTGGDALPGFHVNLYVTAPRLDYTLPEGVLPHGWHFGLQVVQPVFGTELYTRAPGRQGAKFWTAGLGDTTFAPFVLGYAGESSWFGRFATKIKIAQIFPTGEYDPRLSLNKGRNYYSFEPQYGIQFFPTARFTFGANITYIYNWENDVSHYRSGQELAIEPVAEFSPVANLWAGPQGYIYRQLSADRLNGHEYQDGHFGRAYAIGPQIRYTVPGVSVVGKWQHEFDVRNRPDGERFWLQALFKL